MKNRIISIILFISTIVSFANAQESTATIEVIPFSIVAGEEKTIEVELNNPDYSVCGCQFDMYLPEGIEYVLDKYNDPDISGNRSTKITVEGAIQEDGALKVLCYSSKNYTYSGNSGSIVSVKIKASMTLKDGVYEIQLKNIIIPKYEDKTVTKVLPNDYVASVVVGKPDMETVTIKGNVNSDVIDMLSDVFGESETILSMDLSEALAVDEATPFVFENPNVLIFIPEGMSIANMSNVVCGKTCENLQLVDGYAFSAPQEFLASEASYSRSIDSEWGTLCLPFELESDDSMQYYALKKTDVDEDQKILTFTETATVPAGTPTVFCCSNSSDVNIHVSNVTIAKGDAKSATGGMKLIGTYKALSISGDYYYATENTFRHASNSDVTIPTFQAYFEGLGNDVDCFDIGNITETGIQWVENKKQELEIYNLTGQRQQILTKGVNIVNGKKMLTK